MNSWPAREPSDAWSRRQLLQQCGLGLGSVALAYLQQREASAATASAPRAGAAPHFPARAKRVIYLFQSGAPSQLDLFDHKPTLLKKHGEQLPDSVRRGQRLTGMSAGQSTFPLAGSQFRFRQHGQSGAWLSELLPHTADVADELCFVKSMFTEAINHDPAITFLQTGSQLAGRPSIGAWLQYGLGSENHDLPAFVVLVTKGKSGQPLYARLWGSGFLPRKHQGVRFRSGRDAVLYLNNPPGVNAPARRQFLNRLRQLQSIELANDDPTKLEARIAQYEMAFRMQTSVPEVTDVSGEPEWVFRRYGPDSREPGTFAANCLLARRLVERGVKFVQLYHQGWDQHLRLPSGIRPQCQQTDQPSAALVADLRDRGLLEDTLVIWGGEFGRTNYSQGQMTATQYGRDHHPRCFTTWMAGGGVKAGSSYGETCEYGYNIVSDPVHVHDFQATLLHLLGLDHRRLTYRFQGRYFRLTDVHGQVVRGLLA